MAGRFCSCENCTEKCDTVCYWLKTFVEKIFFMGKSSLNHIRKFYCKHVVYKPGKAHSLALRPIAMEWLKFKPSSSLPSETRVAAFNSIFGMNFVQFLMINCWNIFLIWLFFFDSNMKIKFYWAVLNLLHSLIGSFGLEGTSGKHLIQQKELHFI